MIQEMERERMADDNDELLSSAFAMLERLKKQQQSQQTQALWNHFPAFNLPADPRLAHVSESAIPLRMADGRPHQMPSLPAPLHRADSVNQQLELGSPTSAPSLLRPAAGGIPSADGLSLFAAQGETWQSSSNVAMAVSSPRGAGGAGRPALASPKSHTQTVGGRNGYGSRRSTKEHTDDSNTVSMVRASKLKPKVEGVCFDKYFKRWVAKKSGTKKIYFPVHKHGFDSAYELAVETRMRHLQATKGSDGSVGELALPSAPAACLQSASENSLKAIGSPRRRAASILSEEKRSPDSKQHSADVNCDDTQAIKEEGIRKEESDDQIIDPLQEFPSGMQNVLNSSGNTADIAADRLEADDYGTDEKVPTYRSDCPPDALAKSSQIVQNNAEAGTDPPISLPTESVHRVATLKEDGQQGEEEELFRGGTSSLGSAGNQGDSANWPCPRQTIHSSYNVSSLRPPTVSEALQRLQQICFADMDVRLPVNPEIAPKEAIRAAEALVPYPAGIRFDKTTFRWFASFDEPGTGGKRAKTFTAKMFGGCVLRAYEGCLRFRLARCFKTSESNKDLVSCAAPAEESRHAVFRPPDDLGTSEGRGFREEIKEDFDELKRLTPQELLDRAHAFPHSDNIFFHKESHHWAAYVAGQRRTFSIYQYGLKGGYRKALEFKKHVLQGLEAKRRGLLSANKDIDVDDPDFLGNESYAYSGVGSTEGSIHAIISNEREDHPDFGDTKHDTLDIAAPFRDEVSSLPALRGNLRVEEECIELYTCGLFPQALRRRSQRVSGVKRRRVHPENFLSGDALPGPITFAERSLWEAGNNYAKLDCSPCNFMQPHGSCCCVMAGQNTGCAGINHGPGMDCPAGHGFSVPFCLHCLEPSTRQLLHRVVLLCFDQLEAVLLERSRCSSEDKWLRWLSVRLHKDRFSKPAVRQIVDSSSPGEVFSLDIEQWKELLPYVQLFWPFIEQQEVPASLDLCVLAELLQQLHTIAAKNPEHFPEYPVRAEVQRVSGTLAELTQRH